MSRYWTSKHPLIFTSILDHRMMTIHYRGDKYEAVGDSLSTRQRPYPVFFAYSICRSSCTCYSMTNPNAFCAIYSIIVGLVLIYFTVEEHYTERRRGLAPRSVGWKPTVLLFTPSPHKTEARVGVEPTLSLLCRQAPCHLDTWP